ncbi:MAG: energy-coupling factor ABC transporter ATP-binding protein [Candidatus Helarchaeota archaeon]
MEIITIKDLSFAYSTDPDKLVLKDINLKIDKGDFILLCGPTGCGKTTLIECINGLIPHFHGGEFTGTIVVANKNTREYPVYEMSKHVGLVFQNPENQLIAMNIEKELSFALENYGVDPVEMRRRIDEVLRIMDIEDIRYKAPFDLSGGQQQKVAIASILTLNPDIIIFDEPTSNLDPIGAIKILEIINELNKKYGKTIILIEHRLELILKYATKIIVMNEGEIILQGPTESVIINDILEELGLRVPKIIKVYKLLKKDGYNIDKIPFTAENLAKSLLDIMEVGQ